MLTALASDFVNAGYGLVMNQDRARRDAMTAKLLGHYAELDAFLVRHNPSGTFLGDDSGWCEAAFPPMFMRLWFVEYCEGFGLPQESKYARVRRWIDACVAHPAAQQISPEEIVKLYYDYAQGAGNGVLLEGRTRSSFVFEPHLVEASHAAEREIRRPRDGRAARPPLKSGQDPTGVFLQQGGKIVVAGSSPAGILTVLRLGPPRSTFPVSAQIA